MSEVSPESMSVWHDSVTRWLTTTKVQRKDIWEAAEKEIEAKRGILVFEDVVNDKSRSEKMELAP